MNTVKSLCLIVMLLSLIVSCENNNSQKKEEPNVLWIYVDDMSDWMGAYGDNTIPTPNIDKLAKNGVKFNRAYMPAPVCSATRSALITGTMQTTLGIHQHRTMLKKPLPKGVLTIPEIFRKAGYLTFNEEKSDYNFSYNSDDLYSPEFKRPGRKIVKSHLIGHDLTWLKQLKGKKFFGQIQLSGGKWQGEVGSKYPAASRIKESEVTVPKQYPDTPIIRNAIARHYEQIAFCDTQVGAIVEALKEYGLWKNTAVFFFTDHGCQMPRAKQYLYEEGAKVPLIVHWPTGTAQIKEKGAVRNDLVNGIDISATSLGIAGIAIPNSMEGQDLFSKDLEERKHVISAKDRMGAAIDYVRSVRTKDFIYIRNFMTDRALYQANYRDGYYTFKELRTLYKEDKLTKLQASYHNALQRPAEELYNLKNDPNQLNNLAQDPLYIETVEAHRAYLEKWQTKTNDQGMQPINIEELRKVYEKAPNTCKNREYNIFRNVLE